MSYKEREKRRGMQLVECTVSPIEFEVCGSNRSGVDGCRQEWKVHSVQTSEDAGCIR